MSYAAFQLESRRCLWPRPRHVQRGQLAHDKPTEYPREPVKPIGPKPGDEPPVPKPR